MREPALRIFTRSDSTRQGRVSAANTVRRCRACSDAGRLLKEAMDKLSLGAAAYHRILRVARTIADLERAQAIESHHMAEAIQYRSLDRDVPG